jgi:hypothetical protein
MTIIATTPQVLAPVQLAPEGAPQTQFTAPESEAVDAAHRALGAWHTATGLHETDIPPAGVNVYADGADPSTAVWTPAGLLVSAPGQHE